MRHLRNLCYLVIGLLLGANLALVRAETIPATAPTNACMPGTARASCNAFHAQYGRTCEAMVTATSDCVTQTFQIWKSGSNIGTSGGFQAGYRDSSYSCPTGQNWTLSGTSCTRPDCRADQIRGSNGVCSCAAGKTEVGGVCLTNCSGGYHRAVPDNGQCIADCVGMQKQSADGSCSCEAKSYMAQSTYGALKSGCVGGCSLSASAGFFYPSQGVKTLLGQQTMDSTSGYFWMKQTGAICTNTVYQTVTLAPLPQDKTKTTADGGSSDPKNTVDNNKSPDACSAAGGSFAVINGASKCLTDTANSMDKLTVKDNQTVKVNSDGSSSTTNESTQTVCDSTGVCTTKKVTNTTNTAANGATTGSTETGTGTGNGSGSGDGDSKGECAKEPNSPMCKTGVVKPLGIFPDRSGEIEEAKAALLSYFNSIRTQVSSMFGTFGGSSGGALPCPDGVPIPKGEFKVCATPYGNALSPIGAGVMLLAALGSAFIIFRR